MNVKVSEHVKTLMALCTLFKSTAQSIDGVTYRGHFDFEERYSTKHKCDPAYWYPLHLPEHCAEDLEKRVRANIKAMKTAEEDRVARYMVNYLKKKSRNDDPSSTEQSSEEISYQLPAFNYQSMALFQENDDDIDDNSNSISSEAVPVKMPTFSYKVPRPVQPFDKMIYMLNQDLSKNPTAPVVDFLPYIGLSAVYRQPVSQQTVDMIKKTAQEFGEVAEENGLLWKPEPSPEGNNKNNTNGIPGVDEDIKQELKEIKEFIKSIIENRGKNNTDNLFEEHIIENGVVHGLKKDIKNDSRKHLKIPFP